MLELKIRGREQSRASVYFALTREAHDRFRSGLAQSAGSLVSLAVVAEQAKQEAWLKHMEDAIWQLLLQHLFGAMCLEAFIYDYAATNLGDRYVQKYLDKLDLVAKWVVIPRLVLSKEIPRDGQAFQYLRLIKKERDKLVHSKSRGELTEQQRQEELAKYRIRLNPGRSDSVSDKELNVSAQLVDILSALKDLEKDCGREQDWWEILSLSA